MKIKSAELVTMAVAKEKFPLPDLPEIALIGRSNVGKSSFINRMVNRKLLAYTSAKPGKTQTINFYEINQAMRIVDLPGYGFAKVSIEQRNRWDKMIKSFLTGRESLKLVFQIIDSRHLPTDYDMLMFKWAIENDLPLAIILSKCDKLSRGKVKEAVQRLRALLPQIDPERFFAFSAQTGLARDDLWRFITDKLDINQE